MKFAAFFNLIRWKNLLLIAVMQILIKYCFLTGFGFQTTLSNSLFYLLVIATISITASGYIINDVIDLKVDAINKPDKIIIQKEISISDAKKLYFLLTSIGIIIGTYLSIKIEKPIFSLYFIGISVLLYLYSKFLKETVLIGNILVSVLLAFSLFIILFFDIPLPINIQQINSTILIQQTIIIYTIGAFLLNFIREIIKDIEDIDGDYNEGLKTFPIVFGRKRARNFAIFLGLIAIFLLVFITLNLFELKTVTFAYIAIFIIFPLFYFVYRLWNSKTKKQYDFLSKLLKIIVLLGIFSIPIISNHLKYAFN